MKSLDELIQLYSNDYANFIGKPLNKENNESLILFLQYLQFRHLVEMKSSIFKQNEDIGKILSTLNQES